MAVYRFFAPEAVHSKSLVHPVFLSFRGCPVRCVFCAQELQSGQGGRTMAETLAGLDLELSRVEAEGRRARELAFYGGTFTMLPRAEQFAYLELAAKYRAKGVVTKIRASTRPDAVPLEHLAALRRSGLDMLELGVQSFCGGALAASERGYGEEAARIACTMVKDAGLELGIQLMPGMPGMSEEDFRLDIAATVAATPATLRLYPCLVLAGTRLAARYSTGRFAPWSLEKVLPLLVEAQLAAWKAHIRVIRIGLAPQMELDSGGIVAGPVHPALGSMVRGRALFQYVSEQTAIYGIPVGRLALPRYFQGEFWGHKGELKDSYAAMGLTGKNVTWHDEEYCECETAL